MCGRVNTYNKESIYDIMRMFSDVDEHPLMDHVDIRYNVAPGAHLAALYHEAGSSDRQQAAAMHWGLVPLWAKPETFKRPLINARTETVFEKPSFRTLVKQYRCVVAINGFYEWRRADDNKVPHYFQPAQGGVLLLGGLFQFNKRGVAECCLITSAANEVMRPVHHRMPVLIEQQAVTDWLQSEDRVTLENMMQPAAADVLRGYEVSSYVSRATNDGERCIEAVL